MRTPLYPVLCVLAALCSLCVRAADPEPGEVERSLRTQGFVPMKAPPTCGYHDTRSPFYWVSGDISKPIVSTMRPGSMRGLQTSMSGKRFEYTSENRGEWGGSLRVREGNRKPRVLLEANVIHLLPFGEDLLVFAGLAHLGMETGEVFIVDAYDTSPVARLFTRLPEMPKVIAMDEKTRRIAIVTESSVSEIWGNSFSVLTARHFRFPRATSALVSWPNVLIGHCGGVALLELPWRRHRPPAPDGSDELTIVTYWARSRGSAG